jgi:ankyrin repeat protein
LILSPLLVTNQSAQAPLHLAALKGKTEVVDLLLKSGSSLSVMNNEVIKPSVKLRHSNIKLFK